MTDRQTDRHAYLIMCHNNFYILCKLLTALDDNRNDIYIHVDKKAKDCPYETIKDSITNASLYFVKRFSVNWGGYSQIRAELALLDTATKSYHDYYHLISGVDLPLKTQDYIHNYFQEHSGSEFIRYDPNISREIEFQDRIRYYYFLQEFIGRNKGKLAALCYIMQTSMLSFQKKLNIDRLKRCPIKIYKGTNWFSITHNMATFLLKKQKMIKRLCNYGLAADEIFVQTMAIQSPYRENIVNDSLRYIDWKRGNPYTFTVEDYEELRGTDRLFARKFDEKTCIEIVDKLCDHIF